MSLDHRNLIELENELEYILDSPKDKGILQLIVCRPNVDQRQELEQAELNKTKGLKGDSWITRGSSKTEDGSSHPEMQINIMNARSIEVITQDNSRWQLAGDQLFIDMDLSSENLPVGSKLAIGSAVLEITSIPHNGCKKFANRFGKDAVIFVNSEIGKKLHLRGVNAKVTQDGQINKGDMVSKSNYQL